MKSHPKWRTRVVGICFVFTQPMMWHSGTPYHLLCIELFVDIYHLTVWLLCQFFLYEETSWIFTYSKSSLQSLTILVKLRIEKQQRFKPMLFIIQTDRWSLWVLFKRQVTWWRQGFDRLWGIFKLCAESLHDFFIYFCRICVEINKWKLLKGTFSAVKMGCRSFSLKLISIFITLIIPAEMQYLSSRIFLIRRLVPVFLVNHREGSGFNTESLILFYLCFRSHWPRLSPGQRDQPIKVFTESLI